MKNYYYNPKNQDLLIFDTETNEILNLERIVGVRVITSSEIQHPVDDDGRPTRPRFSDNTRGAKPGKKRGILTGNEKKCGYCHSTDHRGKDCLNKPGAKKAASGGKWKCKNCGELGHSAKTCKNPPKAEAAPAEKLPDNEIDAIAREERAADPVPA